MLTDGKRREVNTTSKCIKKYFVFIITSFHIKEKKKGCQEFF
jgi:hypothetical protein